MKRTVQGRARHVEHEQAEARAMAKACEAWAGQDFYIQAVESAWHVAAGEWAVTVYTSNGVGEEA